MLQRKALKAEWLEESSLDPQALVVAAVGKGDRLRIGPCLREPPGFDIVGELHRLARVEIPLPDKPDIGGHVEGVGMDIEVVDHRGQDTHFHDFNGRGRCHEGGYLAVLREEKRRTERQKDECQEGEVPENTGERDHR